jgi:hypothetical protein
VVIPGYGYVEVGGAAREPRSAEQCEALLELARQPMVRQSSHLLLFTNPSLVVTFGPDRKARNRKGLRTPGGYSGAIFDGDATSDGQAANMAVLAEGRLGQRSR